MLKILLYIWQLPQHIIGLFLLIFTKHEKENDYYRWTGNGTGSISLGNYIFVSRYSSDITVRHEKGHQVQSKGLGPLYLIVIGIPSFLWAALRRLGLFRKYSYYDFYTEAWADRIAGIER